MVFKAWPNDGPLAIKFSRKRVPPYHICQSPSCMWISPHGPWCKARGEFGHGQNITAAGWDLVFIFILFYFFSWLRLSISCSRLFEAHQSVFRRPPMSKKVISFCAPSTFWKAIRKVWSWNKSAYMSNLPYTPFEFLKKIVTRSTRWWKGKRTSPSALLFSQKE